MSLANLTEAALAADSFAAEGPVTVDLDASTLVQIGLFIILFLVLKPVLFDPMLKLFEEREKRIDGAKLQARKIDEKSASALTKYETEMAKARASANEERDKLRAEGVKTENEILEKVRKATAASLEQGKRHAREEASRVRATLQTETTQMAKDLAARVLGREVQG
jgi:F-type H+-transporting ATPase subunit b